ncbi:hypothetical protein GGF32_008365 [Allomyces javanicus]|nr:hypothetical protein GGF32_008365 [Allomyces javanicus]
MNNEVLLGPVEFAIWQMGMRILVVGAFVQITYLAVFVHRPGFQVAVTLDLVASVRSLVQFIRHGCTPRQLRRFALAVGLFLLALLATILDYGLDVAFSAYQRDRQIIVAWVRPSNATRRISVPSVQYAMPVHRRTTTALLQSVIQDKLANAGDKAWVRTIGTLTEAEIMAMRVIMAVPFPQPNDESPRVRIGSFSTTRNCHQVDADTTTTQFGTTAFGDFISAYEMSCGQSPDQIDQWLRDHSMTASGRRFSVAVDLGRTKIAGSSMPANVSSARGTRETRSTALHYLDYNFANPGTAPNTATGSAAAVLLHMDPDRAAKGEYEMLLFGSLTTTTNGTMVSPLVMVSEAVTAARQLDAKRRLVFQMAVESAKQTCIKMTGSNNQFTIKNGTIGLDDGAGAADDAKSPFAWVKTAIPNQSDPLHCRVALFGPMSMRSADKEVAPSPAVQLNESLQYLSGAQVCKVTMRTQRSPDPLQSTKFTQSGDYIAVARIVEQDSDHRLQCLDKAILDSVAPPTSPSPSQQKDGDEPRPALTLGFLSRMTGQLLHDTDQFSGQWMMNRFEITGLGELVASDAFTSWTDPDGPQQYTAPAVRVQVWELVGSIALLILTLVLAVADIASLYDTVVTQLFLYPDLRHQLGEKKRDEATARAHRSSAVSLVEDLTFAATLVLIEYPAGMEPKLASESKSGSRSRTIFDVQFVHANQTQVWTPFGPIPLNPTDPPPVATDGENAQQAEVAALWSPRSEASAGTFVASAAWQSESAEVMVSTNYRAISARKRSRIKELREQGELV